MNLKCVFLSRCIRFDCKICVHILSMTSSWKIIKRTQSQSLQHRIWSIRSQLVYTFEGHHCWSTRILAFLGQAASNCENMGISHEKYRPTSVFRDLPLRNRPFCFWESTCIMLRCPFSSFGSGAYATLSFIFIVLNTKGGILGGRGDVGPGACSEDEDNR